MSRSVHTATCVVVLSLLLMCLGASAYKISFNREHAMGFYSHKGYRQYPHWIIGVFGPTSPPAVGSGNGGVHPTVQVSLEIINPPNDFFQFVIYDAEEIEGRVLANVPHAHPCMFRGQVAGVAQFHNMSGLLFTEQAIGRGSEVMYNGALRRSFAIAGSFVLKKTGMYVMTMNSCRYIAGTGSGNASVPLQASDLVVTGWHDAVITGYFQIRNPYGYLPGELYGMLPGFAVLFAFITLTFIIYVAMCLRIVYKTQRGFRALQLFHWVMCGVLFLTFLSYAVFVGYYSHYNTFDENKLSTFATAVVILKLRDALALCGFFLLSYGVSVTQARLPHHLSVSLGITVVLHVACSLASYKFQSMIEFDTKRSGGAENDAEQPTLARGAATIGVAVTTGVVLCASVYYLAVHCRRLSPKVVGEAAAEAQATGGEVHPIPTRQELMIRREKFHLYLRTSILSGLLLLAAAVWAYVQANHYSVKDDKAAETPDNWKTWWAPTIVPQLIVTIGVIVMSFLWPPLVSSCRLQYVLDPSAVNFNDPRYRDGEEVYRVYTVREKSRAQTTSTGAAMNEDAPTPAAVLAASAATAAANARLGVDYSDEEEELQPVRSQPSPRPVRRRSASNLQTVAAAPSAAPQLAAFRIITSVEKDGDAH